MSARTRVSLVGLLALVLAIGVFSLRPPLLERLELLLLDWRFQARGPEPPVAPIAIAAIDKRSVDALGRWPWRRDIQARLFERLAEAGVAAIGVDVVYSEPELSPDARVVELAREALAEQGRVDGARVLETALAEADPDRRLAASLRRSGRVALGYFFRTGPEEEDEQPPDDAQLAERLELVRKGRVKVHRLEPRNESLVDLCWDVEPSLAVFQDAAQRVGFFSTDPDLDGAIRRASLVSRCGDGLYISLDLAVLAVITGGDAMVLPDDDGRLQVKLGGTLIGTDEGGKILIDYRGPPGTFPRHSIVDIIEGRVDPAELAGRIVLVGPTETGIQDIYPTPFGSKVPGIEIHANVIDNLISGQVLRRDDGYLLYELLAIAIIGLVLIAAIPRMGALRGALLGGLLLAGVVAAAFWLFTSQGIWVWLSYVLVGVGVTYLALAVTQSTIVEAQGRRVRRQFATYVSPQVAEQMIQHPDRFRLGGERRDLSILFSDVADFTTISEELGPEKVVELMNAYLNRMTHIVLESRGTLDKYIGDAVMAFWGAPLEVEDHPLRAAESALAMQEGISELQREHPDLPAVERLHVRIGVHADEVSVGNMGSELRFDYTLTGDGVNTCARLEGLNKYYGTKIMASGEMVYRLPEDFLVRELDEIRVKGKRQGVRIFEMLGRRGPTGPEAEWLETYAAGLTAYRAGAWDDAERHLRDASRLREDDEASRLLLERIGSLRAAPPEDWDGVWSFQTK